MSEDEAIQFLQQILLGLAYMHAHHIAHFDLKVLPVGGGFWGAPCRRLVGQRLSANPTAPPSLPQPENIMLLEKDTPSPKIKIIDFGLAQKLEEGVAYKSLCGTPQYIGTALGPRNREAEERSRSPTCVAAKPLRGEGDPPTLEGKSCLWGKQEPP